MSPYISYAVATRHHVCYESEAADDKCYPLGIHLPQRMLVKASVTKTFTKDTVYTYHLSQQKARSLIANRSGLRLYAYVSGSLLGFSLTLTVVAAPCRT